MTEKKRFQSQTLNSDDYKKTEDDVMVSKSMAIIGGAAAGLFLAVKKYGPNIIKLLKRH